MINFNVCKSKIIMGTKIMSDLSSLMLGCPKSCKAFVITDTNVSEIYLEYLKSQLKKLNLEVHYYIIPAGEFSKSLKTVENIYEKLSGLYDNIKLYSEYGQSCLLKIDSLVSFIISQISYLFKHDSYKHENEVRLIVNRANNNLDDVKIISGEIPKIYIYNDAQSYIDEIILGSKMENPEDYVPFIHKQSNKMWNETKEGKIKVTHSAIQYR